MSDNKKIYGQFYTTNYKYILTDLNIIRGVKEIIEPFVGNGDLIKYIEEQEKINNCKYKLSLYDIEPKKIAKRIVKKQDTILNPPNYKNKYIITNPPYLARNKTTDNEIFNDENSLNDLYKCFINTIITNPSSGGILIIPLNFWCSIRKMDIDLRKKFLNIYDIIQLNIFEEQVFDDTSYTICSFSFINKIDNIINRVERLNINDVGNQFIIKIFPSMNIINAELTEENSYLIGGDIYNLPKQSLYKISRLTTGDIPNTNINAKCIDDNINNKIRLEIVDDDKIFIDTTTKKSARSYAGISIVKNDGTTLTNEQQIKLVIDFNTFLNEYRDRYNSLFMSNFRESNTIARKRISFDLIYLIIGHCLSQQN